MAEKRHDDYTTKKSDAGTDDICRIPQIFDSVTLRVSKIGRCWTIHFGFWTNNPSIGENDTRRRSLQDLLYK